MKFPRRAHNTCNLSKPARCQSDWNTLPGGERVRVCSKGLHRVYDVSGLTQEEALALIAKAEEKESVRMLRRRDGKFVDTDCVSALDYKTDLHLAVIPIAIIVSVGSLPLGLMLLGYLLYFGIPCFIVYWLVRLIWWLSKLSYRHFVPIFQDRPIICTRDGLK